MVTDTIKVSATGFIAALALALFGLIGTVSAGPAAGNKVTICHGTNSVNNPYVQNSVDADAADGNTGNDSGQGDHSTHTGPVATSEAVAQSLKNAKTAWGDIIPPHNNYAGLNWTAAGQAVYNAGCKYATPGSGGGGTVAGTSTTGGAQSVAPNGAVAGGAGGATSLSTAALIGLVSSIAAVGTGLTLAIRQRL